ncbi:MAG TPA: carboxypeptidase-like regulatory domain-containing protein, partial [Myxococcales bacterium]|nr:carboxypeptidase-like regulatory domain-containing protein [Myxococcales bacterium]
MKRAAAIALLLCSCSLRAPRNNSSTCTSNDQCGGGNVCFLGQCRGHSTSLALVAAEVQPAGGSAFSLTQAANLNLQLSVVQDFEMTPSVLVTGNVSQTQSSGGLSPAQSATVTFSSRTPLIADRALQAAAQTSSSGNFSLRATAAAYDIEVQPQPPLPPFKSTLTFPPGASSSTVPLVLPARSALVTAQGSVSAGGADLSGASITAVDDTGNVISAPGQIDAGNVFSLLLPPGTTNYFLEVGPPASSSTGGIGAAGPPDGGTVAAPDGGISEPPSELASLPNFDPIPGANNVTVALPQVATLAGTVVDAQGQPLANVPVYARSDGGEPFTLARQVLTDSTGAFVLVLRAGVYMVEAAPSSSGSAAVSVAQPIALTAAGMTGLQLICPRKISRTGVVLLQTGPPAGPGYQITATRIADPLLTTRLATTIPTSADGLFLITGDPGTYRIEVAP